MRRGRTPEYEAYLQSPDWEAIRRERMHKDQWQCKNCHRTRGLQVHHWYYQRGGASLLGREDLDDLVTLCGGCHAALTKRRQEVFETGPTELSWVIKGLALMASVFIFLWWWASH